MKLSGKTIKETTDTERAWFAMEACRHLVATIRATGGLVEFPDGTSAPVADPEWIDLVEAYEMACAAQQEEPLYQTPP